MIFDIFDFGAHGPGPLGPGSDDDNTTRRHDTIRKYLILVSPPPGDGMPREDLPHFDLEDAKCQTMFGATWGKL